VGDCCLAPHEHFIGYIEQATFRQDEVTLCRL